MSAFAVDVAIGGQSGYGQFVFLEVTDGMSYNLVPVKVDAMFYFGDSFALNAALGLDFYTEDIFYDVFTGGGSKTGFVVDLLAYYNLNLADNMNLLLGGGASFHRIGCRANYNGVYTEYSYNFLSLLGSVRFEFEATDHLAAFAAVDVGYNVMNNVEIKPVGIFEGGSMETSILPWAIKAGASYKF